MKSTAVFSIATRVILPFTLTLLFPLAVNAQSPLYLERGPTGHEYRMTSTLVSAALLPGMISPESYARNDRCLQIARPIGAISGCTMGVLHIYWSVTGASGTHCSLEKNLATGIPSAIIGAYVGIKAAGWATKRIMKGEPKPAKALLKGVLYGAAAGTVTLAAGLTPLLLIGHYTGSIDFNSSDEPMILKLLGASALGGIVYGGAIGAAVGAVGGTSLSLYMKF